MNPRKRRVLLLGLTVLSFAGVVRADEGSRLLDEGLGKTVDFVRMYFAADDKCLSPEANESIKKLEFFALAAGWGGAYVAGKLAPSEWRITAAALGAALGTQAAEWVLNNRKERLGASRDLMMMLGGNELVCVTIDMARKARQPVVGEFEAFVVKHCELPGVQLGELDDFLAMTRCVEGDPLLRNRAAKYLADLVAINRAHCLVAQEGLHRLAREQLEKQLRGRRDSSVQPLDIPQFDCDSPDSLRELYGPLLAIEVASLQK